MCVGFLLHFVFQLTSSSAHITWHAPTSDDADSNIWSLESRGAAPPSSNQQGEILGAKASGQRTVIQFEKWACTKLKRIDDGSGLF